MIWNYSTFAFSSNPPICFIKSECYRSVEKWLKRQLTIDEIMLETRTSVMIKGPKGVGKTMCLMALWHKMMKRKDVLAVMTSGKSFTLANSTIRKYYKMLAESINMDHDDDYTSFVEFLCSFIRTAQKITKVVLLMDIDDVRDVTKLNNMSDVIRNIQDSKVILLATLTSGEGSNVLGENLSSFLSLDEICQEIDFLPFSDEEVMLYKDLYNIQFDFEKDLRYVTGYNPQLLALAASYTILSHLKKAVFRNVSNFVHRNLKHDGTLPEAF